MFRLLAVDPPKRRRQVLPGLHIALKAASHLPFPALFSWREIAVPLLRKSNINSNSSSGSIDKVTAVNRRGPSSHRQQALLCDQIAPLPPLGGGQSRGVAVAAGGSSAPGGGELPAPSSGAPRRFSHARSLSSCLAAAGRMLTSASSATARALTASPTSKPSARGAASGRARCRSWRTRSTS